MQDIVTSSFNAACTAVPVLLLALLAWKDVRDGRLPDTLTALLAVAAVGLHMLAGGNGITPEQSLVGAALGGGLLLALRQGSIAIWKQEILGLDYVKLMAAGGLLVGAPHIIMALGLGAGFGMVQSLVIWRQEPAGVTLGKINVPAGLGLGLGIAIVWLMQNGFLMK